MLHDERFTNFCSTGIKILADYGNVEEAYGMSPAELCQKIKDFDALIIRSATQVDMQLVSLSHPAVHASLAPRGPTFAHLGVSKHSWVLGTSGDQGRF